MKQIQIRIFPDGKIETKTVNIKGKKCMDYIVPIQSITEAQVVDSEFTQEFYENDELDIIVDENYERNE